MSIPFYSDVDLKNNKITNLGAPMNNNDASNKDYVDIAIDNLHTEISGEIADEVSTLNTSIGNVDTKIDNLDDGLNTRIETVVQPIIDDSIANNIVDGLTSLDANKSLSANQGRVLDNRIDAVRDLITVNTYSTEPAYIGTYLNAPLYRVVISGTFEEKPASGIFVIYSDAILDTTKSYKIKDWYGTYIQNYDNTKQYVNKFLYSSFTDETVSGAISLGSAMINTDGTKLGTTILIDNDVFNDWDTMTQMSPFHYEIIFEYIEEVTENVNE